MSGAELAPSRWGQFGLTNPLLYPAGQFGPPQAGQITISERCSGLDAGFDGLGEAHLIGSGKQPGAADVAKVGGDEVLTHPAVGRSDHLVRGPGPSGGAGPQGCNPGFDAHPPRTTPSSRLSGVI
jgi:hypothetical protein